MIKKLLLTIALVAVTGTTQADKESIMNLNKKGAYLKNLQKARDAIKESVKEPPLRPIDLVSKPEPEGLMRPKTRPTDLVPQPESDGLGLSLMKSMGEAVPIDKPSPKRRPKDLIPQDTEEEEDEDDFDGLLIQRLVDEEEFQEVAHRATEGEEHWTIGFGHYGIDVKEGQRITRKDAMELLKKDINKRLPAIRKSIPSFKDLSTNLKIEIAQSWFRGGISGSPETIKLINKGEFKKASVEFLDNDEYRNAKQRKRSGIIPRMEALSNALAKEGSKE